MLLLAECINGQLEASHRVVSASQIESNFYVVSQKLSVVERSINILLAHIQASLNILDDFLLLIIHQSPLERQQVNRIWLNLVNQNALPEEWSVLLIQIY